MYVFVQNQFVESEKAVLHVSDLAIQRGYGIFDFFRVRDNVLLFVEDHLDRFLRSAAIMHLQPLLSKEKLLLVLQELAQRNNLPQSGIKMILTGGYSPDAYQPATPNLIISQTPLNIPDPEEPKTVNIITHEFMRDLPEAKTINYSMGIWLQKKIVDQHADDVLYHTGGLVTEFPRCNFFIVDKNGVIITPDKNALPGITRKRILELAATQYRIKEAPVLLSDVWQAKEAFLTSSTKRIQSIVSVGGRTIGNGKPGEVTGALLKMLVDSEKSYVRQHQKIYNSISG